MSYLSASSVRNHYRLARLSLLPLMLIIAAPVLVFSQGSGRSSQGTNGSHVIKGFVFFPSGRRADGTILVKLQSYNSGEISVIADSSGAFTFTGLSPGNYTVVVNAGESYEVGRDSVYIDSDVNLSRMGIPVINASRTYTVMLTLQLKNHPNSGKPGVINAALAEVPPEARKLYEKGVELSRAGKPQEAIESLRTAVSLYPKFPLALNELGAQYLKISQPERAIEFLKSATRLNPDAFSPPLNLGVAYLETMRFAEAETQLREAVRLNDSAVTAHMYLGITLVKLKRYDEARKTLEASLTKGGDGLAPVHRYLGGLYMNEGKHQQAADELEKYLQMDPKAANADRIRGTIKELRGKS